jgi:hypothetical protein
MSKIDDVTLQRDDEFTAAERIELADIMIARWTEYKRAAERGEK